MTDKKFYSYDKRISVPREIPMVQEFVNDMALSSAHFKKRYRLLNARCITDEMMQDNQYSEMEEKSWGLGLYFKDVRREVAGVRLVRRTVSWSAPAIYWKR